MANVHLDVVMLEGMWSVALKADGSVHHVGASTNYDQICGLAERLASELIAEGHEPAIHHPVMSDALPEQRGWIGLR